MTTLPLASIGDAYASPHLRDCFRRLTDTADKLDLRDLRDLAIHLATGLVRLAERADGLDPIPASTVRARIPDATAEYLRMDGRWPW